MNGSDKAPTAAHVAVDLRESVAHEGSWWLDWNAWLAERDEATRRAPRRLGSRRYPILGDAPGEYVHER
jgi:polyhydroxyalkanoate synthase subunit PhaC